MVPGLLVLFLAGTAALGLLSSLQRDQGTVTLGFVEWVDADGAVPLVRLTVTNATPYTICCEQFGYLEPGEHETNTVALPAGAEPSGVELRWQRRDLTRAEQRLNAIRWRIEEWLGSPSYHRDPWYPPTHVAHSPPIPRPPPAPPR